MNKKMKLKQEKIMSKKILKQQRKENRLRQEKRRNIIKRVSISVFLIAIMASIIFIFIEKQKPLPGEAVEVMKDNTHLQVVETAHTPYNSNPPTSGQHVQNIANWGIHSDPVEKETLVHNLEDGGVVIYYNDEADKNTISRLEQIVDKYDTHALLNPYPEMNDKIVLTAWGRIDRLNEFDENRIASFINAFKGIDHH